MTPSTKTLGALGIAGAPFLFFEMLLFSKNNMANSSVGGLCDLLYMLGWMCTIIGLHRLKAAGGSQWARIALYVQLGLLCVANVWNVWTIVDPKTDSFLYKILDAFWPASNAWLLVVGITVAMNKTWEGWRRYCVAAAGMWLPLCFAVGPLLANCPAVMFYVISGYSIMTWALMGWAVFTANKKEPRLRLAL